jgi:hypothetical protein
MAGRISAVIGGCVGHQKAPDDAGSSGVAADGFYAWGFHSADI